ncbi:MAG: hypothetical protein CSA07_02320 [Bacteroidia bacterium]|nr:MAG: hypothetical protein CSA07_02320 [Bacteroidia bacterium]
MPSDNPVDQRIVDFIKAHHVLNLATSYRDEPWCASCFYVYQPERNSFIFTSSIASRHISDIAHNCFVAASIVLETRTVGRIQGLQLQGLVTRVDPSELVAARRAYIREYPYAVLSDLTLWQLDVSKLKYTDNRLGFGTKLHWSSSGDFDDLLSSLRALSPEG